MATLRAPGRVDIDGARAAALLLPRPRLQQADLIYSLPNGL